MLTDRSDTSDPRRLRDCRQCGTTLSVFHRCPRLALKEQAEALTQAVVETPQVSTEEDWEEIRRRFPLTADRIIAAITEGTEE